LKIKAKPSTGTSEEPKTAPIAGALLVERPKPKIVVRPVPPKREEPQQPIKQMPRSVFFDDDKKGESKPEEAAAPKKFAEHVSALRHE
jgi:hypothetical protein